MGMWLVLTVVLYHHDRAQVCYSALGIRWIKTVLDQGIIKYMRPKYAHHIYATTLKFSQSTRTRRAPTAASAAIERRATDFSPLDLAEPAAVLVALAEPLELWSAAADAAALLTASEPVADALFEASEPVADALFVASLPVPDGNRNEPEPEAEALDPSVGAAPGAAVPVPVPDALDPPDAPEPSIALAPPVGAGPVAELPFTGAAATTWGSFTPSAIAFCMYASADVLFPFAALIEKTMPLWQWLPVTLLACACDRGQAMFAGEGETDSHRRPTSASCR
jgi:hypothetical protein